MARQEYTKGKRPLAIVTGASSGIGLELAREAAERGYDLIIAADRSMDEVAAELRAEGAQVDAVMADLATREGVDELHAEHTLHPALIASFSGAGDCGPPRTRS